MMNSTRKNAVNVSTTTKPPNAVWLATVSGPARAAATRPRPGGRGRPVRGGGRPVGGAGEGTGKGGAGRAGSGRDGERGGGGECGTTWERGAGTGGSGAQG